MKLVNKLKINELLKNFGCIDGAHHKQWVIDQIARLMYEENYDLFIEEYCNGEDGPETYEWDEGIAP